MQHALMYGFRGAMEIGRRDISWETVEAVKKNAVKGMLTWTKMVRVEVVRNGPL